MGCYLFLTVALINFNMQVSRVKLIESLRRQFSGRKKTLEVILDTLESVTSDAHVT